ncbi:MAG: hypothetical protein QXQ46_08085 [Thermoplasmatales archaeon]
MHSFYGFTVEKELKRLDRFAILEDCKRGIRDFLNDIRLKDNLTENRIYYYAVRLRKVTEIISDRFMNPDAQGIKNVISEIAQMEHVSGKRYSENTVEDYKIAVKRFYRWLLANDGDVPEVVK